MKRGVADKVQPVLHGGATRAGRAARSRRACHGGEVVLRVFTVTAGALDSPGTEI